ncbi:hypothetical protein ABN063_03135 [Providencia vermicola]|uniref:hypothetical protein n=1 Tax=Providencia vermicola TaxID=333965 RepID=UPI0032DB578A
MSISVNTIVKTPFSFSNIIKTCSKFNRLIKSIKNTNSPCIKLCFNHKHIELDTHNLLSKLKDHISAKTDYETFKEEERKIQIFSAINSVIDEIQAMYLADPQKNLAVINSEDKGVIFKNVQRYYGLQESDILLNASQSFIRQRIQYDPNVDKAIQHLKIDIDIEKIATNLDIINADRKATTKYVVELINDTVCKDFYPDIDFGKIRESAAQSTRHILENKLSQYHCKKIDYYILRTEGTAV